MCEQEKVQGLYKNVLLKRRKTMEDVVMKIDQWRNFEKKTKKKQGRIWIPKQKGSSLKSNPIEETTKVTQQNGNQ